MENVADYFPSMMSDYEEEHFPVTVRTSFSSSFDADWQESAAVADFAPIRRSLSEFCRGERMTVDTVGHICQNVYPKEEVLNSFDDDNELDDLNSSCNVKSVSYSPCIAQSKNSVCVNAQSRRCHPEVDMEVDSSAAELCSLEHKRVNGYDVSNETQCAKSAGEAVYQLDLLLHRAGQIEDESVHSQSGSSGINDVRQRVVSEIRNNIPEVGQVRSCSQSGQKIRQTSPEAVLRGRFTQFQKRSPGVAKRLEATTPSHDESTDMSVMSSAEFCDGDEGTADESSGTFMEPSIAPTGNIASSSVVNVTLSTTTDAAEASTEKESQSILSQHSLNIIDSLQQMSRTWDSLSDDSARRTDPFRYSGMLPDAVLFTTSDDPVADQTIRLSPELTECDSDNVSTLEDDNEADVISGCLPVVEDGLSCSDTDDIPTSSPPSNYSSAVQSDFVEMDILHKLPVSETEVMDFFSGSCDTTGVKDDPVEKAIRDIRQAMERSKGFATGCPRKSHSVEPQSARQDGETIWISRAL